MTILRYEPWSLVNRLHRHLDEAFTADASDADGGAWWIPQVDVHEESERFAVLVDVPGVEPKDIEITAEKGVLTIRGERHARTTEETSGAYRRLERRSGKFLRRFTLPDSANLDAISAKHTQGVLEVTIPKQAKLQPRRIEVAAA